MKNKMIPVGTCVPALKVSDVSFNTEKIIRIMKENKDLGILVFPELCITGYTCADLFSQDLLLRASEDALLRIARESTLLKGLLTVIGLPVRIDHDLYNCAAYINEGKILGIVPKIHIPSYSEFYESRWFKSGYGMKGKVIEIQGRQIPFGTDIIIHDRKSGVKVGTEICEDLWVPDKPSTHLCLGGAHIICNLSASDELIGKQDYRRMIVSDQSASCYCAYIYVSSGVYESSTDLVFSGHSIIAENGRILKDNIFADPDHVETSLIDLDTIAYNRTHQNTYTTYGDNTYACIDAAIQSAGEEDISVEAFVESLKKYHYSVSGSPFVPSDDTERKKRCQKILQIQANGLATRVRSTGIHNLIIGVSGGLDSTLAMLVCHEAQKIVPDIHIIAYTMPNKGNTSSQTYNNAIALIRLLNAECRELNIAEGVNLHLKELGHGTTYLGDGDTTYENAQARYRTYILMDAANMENGLVVGTGDLSELALGWCTYNGDHMSMYGVNSSIPKTLVQYICRTYALSTGNKELRDVLLSICDTPISPELTPSSNGQIAQKTEEKIGKYDLNDFFLFYTLRYGFTPEKILALSMYAYANLTKEEIKEAEIRFYNRFFHQQFKRSCLPDGPKVGSVSLSPRGDWRMPSDASVNLWIEELKKA